MPPDFDPPFCPSRMLVRANDGTINRVLLPIDLPIGITLLLQGFQHALPNPGLLPPIKPACDSLPAAVALGEIAPGRSSANQQEEGVDDRAMVIVRSAGERLLWREERSEPLPLMIGEFMSCHTPAYDGFADTP